MIVCPTQHDKYLHDLTYFEQYVIMIHHSLSLFIFADFASFIAHLCLDQHTTPYKHKLNHT